MNQPDPFDRLISDWLQEGAYEAPEEAVQTATQHALRHPRMPDPFAFLRKDAMNSSRSVLGLPPVLAAAILLLIVAVVAAAAGGMFRPKIAVVSGPTPGPSSAAQATSTAAPTSTPILTTSQPSPTGSQAPYVLPAEPGGPIPDSMLGSWFDRSSKAFPWIFRAGNAYCASVLSTSQDCMAWDLGNGSVPYGAAMTIIGNTVALRYLNGGGCRDAQGKYTWVIKADTFTLTRVGGDCVSGDYTFLRAGTGTTLTSPPQPTP